MTLYGHFYLNKRQPSCDSCFCHGLSRWSTSAVQLCPAEKAGRYSCFTARPCKRPVTRCICCLLRAFTGKASCCCATFCAPTPKAVAPACEAKKAAFAQCSTGPGAYVQAKTALHAQLLGTAVASHRAPLCTGGETVVTQEANTVHFPPVARTFL